MVLVFDTDPGVDDMLAILSILATDPLKSELRMITLTYGNCSLQNTLNNLLSMFYVTENENKWRTSHKMAPFTKQCPFVYLGSTRALTGDELPEHQELIALENENVIDATDVHGNDGLAGIHSSRPEFDAPKQWFDYFGKPKPESIDDSHLPFKPGYNKPAWTAILELLASEPPNTVTIIAVGPLTNLAKAAANNPVVFTRVKEVLSMGAALRHPGNITPLAEFNVFADPLAAAQVYALTSKNPQTVMPRKTPPNLFNFKPATPLNLLIFPLDITEKHNLTKNDVDEEIGGALRRYPNSMLTQWIYSWLTASFANYGRLVGKGPENAECHLHDPLTAAYALSSDMSQWVLRSEDVRVETEGQWSAGSTIVDERGRQRIAENPHDLHKWLTLDEGNRVQVVLDTPFKTTFNRILMKQIINLEN